MKNLKLKIKAWLLNEKALCPKCQKADIIREHFDESVKFAYKQHGFLWYRLPVNIQASRLSLQKAINDFVEELNK